VPADQAWFWEKGWQEGERLVDEDVAGGRVLVSPDIEQFLSDIGTARKARPRPQPRKRRATTGE